MNNKLHLFGKWIFASILMVSFLTACQDEDPAITTDQSTASYDNEVVIKWNDLILFASRQEERNSC